MTPENHNSIPVSSTAYERTAKASLDEIRFITEIIKGAPCPKTMVDVGAHHGICFAPFLSQGWRILAFEPDSTNRQLIEMTFGKNSNLTILSEAVFDEDGKNLDFFTSEVSTGISSLNAFHQSHKTSQTVQTITLDTALQNNAFENVGFLKVDVEGYEQSVLKGFDIARWSPEVVMLEYEDRKSQALGYTARDLIESLTAHGYAVFVSEFHPVVEYGQAHDWQCLKEYPCELPSENWGNLIAFKTRPSDDAIDRALKKSLRFRAFRLLHLNYPTWRMQRDLHNEERSIQTALSFQIYRGFDFVLQGLKRLETLARRLKYYLHKERTTFSPTSRAGS